MLIIAFTIQAILTLLPITYYQAQLLTINSKLFYLVNIGKSASAG